MFKNWYQALKDEHGRFTKDELRRKLEIVDDRLTFYAKNVRNFLNYIEDQDDVNITKGRTGGNGTRYFVHTGYTLQPYLDQVPGEYEDVLRKLVGQGVSPNSVVAAVDLIEDDQDRTQREVAANNGVCEVTVRNVRDKIIDHEASPVTGDAE